MVNDNPTDTDAPTATTPEQHPSPTLPNKARLPFNRCNLPAAILGSLTFQQHPTTLTIDGVAELHRHLFEQLDLLTTAEERATRFCDYMTVYFRLEALEEIGLTQDIGRGRPKAHYLQLLRGWMFDSDSREGAVMKGWVESRFGLIPRFHKQEIRDPEDDSYDRFMHERTLGLYNTNALEAQLDLLYAYCQYELQRIYGKTKHITLYRGVHSLPEQDWLTHEDKGNGVVLFNNLNSFSVDPERADEFGELVLQTQVPLAKILFFSGLLPGRLVGEGEYIVIGGIYKVSPASY